MLARPSPPSPRTCCPSALAKLSMWTAAFISGDSNVPQDQHPPYRPNTPAQGRTPLRAFGGEDSQFGTGVETLAGRPGLHGERPLHLTRLDRMDAGLPVRLGVAPVDRKSTRLNSSH